MDMTTSLSDKDGSSDVGVPQEACAVFPPPDFRLSQPEAPSRAPERHFDIPAISEELAQEAFTNYVSSKCCYSSKPAREMVFTDLQSLNTYRYRLETFTESRSTEWHSVPYIGQEVDGYGVPPDPWSIPVPILSNFQDCEKFVSVPHTSKVKACSSCMTLGKTRCINCGGVGRASCGYCGGMGATYYGQQRQFCSACGGTGRKWCYSCQGLGRVTCITCDGHGKLLWFINLKVTWKNNIHMSVIDKGSEFQLKLLDQVSGATLFSDVAPMVYPVVGFPDSSVNAASEAALREHQSQFSHICCIRHQRQTIELIPITTVYYLWKQKPYSFFVYGNEHKVYTKDYPGKCCCCSIL